mgnify:CR=1 FL=1
MGWATAALCQLYQGQQDACLHVVHAVLLASHTSTCVWLLLLQLTFCREPRAQFLHTLCCQICSVLASMSVVESMCVFPAHTKITVCGRGSWWDRALRSTALQRQCLSRAPREVLAPTMGLH